MHIIPDLEIYCPLYKKSIAEGLCLDINLQSLGYFKVEEELKTLQKTLSKELIIKICSNCPNQPL